MIARLRQALAARRLARIVEANRRSFEIRDFARRREASKRGWQRRKGAVV